MPKPVRIVNQSVFPDDEVDRIIRFVLDRPQVDLSAATAVRVTSRTFGGWAFDMTKHTRRKWVGRARFGMTVHAPVEWSRYGKAHVCGHASRATVEAIDEAHARGDTRFGRWPIVVLNDWRDVLVHTAAHEARHLVQYDNDRPVSEVDCEEWAAKILAEWQKV